ncbi:hypothetical protein B4070_0221 [Bacillus subtilis]|nr:hypothetical protein B4070_0221 [Bacillus subtilis]
MFKKAFQILQQLGRALMTRLPSCRQQVFCSVSETRIY